MQKVASLGSKANGNSVHPVPNNIQRSGVSAVQGHTKVLAIRALIIILNAIICEWKVSFNKAKWEASTTCLFLYGLPALDPSSWNARSHSTALSTLRCTSYVHSMYSSISTNVSFIISLTLTHSSPNSSCSSTTASMALSSSSSSVSSLPSGLKVLFLSHLGFPVAFHCCCFWRSWKRMSERWWWAWVWWESSG